MAPTNGFTLIEILVVMGLLVLIGGLGLFVSMESYQGSNFRSERDLLVTLLEHARAQAINTVCIGSCTDGVAHGVEITPEAYTVFQSSYVADDSQNQSFPTGPTVTHAGDTDAIFSPLTGAVATQKVITLTGDGKSSTITIEPNGRIWWTK